METFYVSTSFLGDSFQKGSPASQKRTEVVVCNYATSSASNNQKPRSFLGIEAEATISKPPFAQKQSRAGQLLFAYFALFANPVKTILSASKV